MYSSSNLNKRIFISFDYDNDKHYRYLLSALAENARFTLDFDDVTPQEIQSSDIGRIKAALTNKIKSATHTLVVIGSCSNNTHPDHNAIGEKNWQWWEIKQSIFYGKKIVAVKINYYNPTPDPLYNQNIKWVNSFKVPDLESAINSS